MCKRWIGAAKIHWPHVQVADSKSREPIAISITSTGNDVKESDWLYFITTPYQTVQGQVADNERET
jgi:hypothetical protein